MALLFGFCAITAFHAPLNAASRSSPIVMSASKGPFPIPDPPADFAGAQWAPHVFKPFPINIKKAATQVKEILKEETKAAVVEAPAAPVEAPAAPVEAAPPAADKDTFTVSLTTPDGPLSFECPPGEYILDAAEELDNADDFADLPYACRAGSCSACAGKLVKGTMDLSACSFLTPEQKADGWVLTCTAKPTSDCVIETHKEDDMY